MARRWRRHQRLRRRRSRRPRTRVRLGYLHVVAVDGHIWTGLDRGSFDREGIDFELHAFNTGPEVFEAMALGEIDVLSAGGVISNYLALGRGRGFLINDIEVATAQLWVRPTLGVTEMPISGANGLRRR
jgi:NitT/TauT family transport system substrate-binding protein